MGPPDAARLAAVAGGPVGLPPAAARADTARATLAATARGLSCPDRRPCQAPRRSRRAGGDDSAGCRSTLIRLQCPQRHFMANILLGVTGSVAAIKTPELVCRPSAARPRGQGRRDGLRASTSSTRSRSTRRASFAIRKWWSSTRTSGPAARTVGATAVATRSGTSSCGAGPNLFLVAPLDANTLAKFAIGLCDNCLTCVWRAWDPGRPLVIAPAMNTFMWEHPLTRRHLRALAADAGGGTCPDTSTTSRRSPRSTHGARRSASSAPR